MRSISDANCADCSALRDCLTVAKRGKAKRGESACSAAASLSAAIDFSRAALRFASSAACSNGVSASSPRSEASCVSSAVPPSACSDEVGNTCAEALNRHALFTIDFGDSGKCAADAMHSAATTSSTIVSNRFKVHIMHVLNATEMPAVADSFAGNPDSRPSLCGFFARRRSSAIVTALAK